MAHYNGEILFNEEEVAEMLKDYDVDVLAPEQLTGRYFCYHAIDGTIRAAREGKPYKVAPLQTKSGVRKVIARL